LALLRFGKQRRKEPSMRGGDWLGVLALGFLGLAVINEISKAKWCGPNRQIILSDARGTLIQDMVTGALRWI
jgi:hypothetical protein